MAITNNPKRLRVRSKAFGLWKDKEKREGRHITIDAICKETGLAKLTVRRFLALSEDVNGSRLDAAAVLADYFEAGLETLLEVQEGEPIAETKDAAA